MSQLRSDACHVWKTSTWTKIEDRVRKEEVNDYLHAPNICDDSYLIEIGTNPFENDGTNEPDVSAMLKALFEDAYNIPYKTVKDLRMYFLPMPGHPTERRNALKLTFSHTGGFKDGRNNPQNIAHIFRWLVAYITRYEYWRGDAMGAVREFTHPNHPDKLSREKYKRQWKRWIRRTENAFDQFKKALNVMMQEYKKLKLITMASHTRLKYTIQGLSALVGSSKVRFQTI